MIMRTNKFSVEIWMITMLLMTSLPVADCSTFLPSIQHRAVSLHSRNFSKSIRQVIIKCELLRFSTLSCKSLYCSSGVHLVCPVDVVAPPLWSGIHHADGARPRGSNNAQGGAIGGSERWKEWWYGKARRRYSSRRSAFSNTRARSHYDDTQRHRADRYRGSVLRGLTRRGVRATVAENQGTVVWHFGTLQTLSKSDKCTVTLGSPVHWIDFRR